MADNPTNLPSGLTFRFEADPSVDMRRALGVAINAFHARSVPFEVERFGLWLNDEGGKLAAGLSGALSWGWLFVEGLWVDDDWRGQGVGRALMGHAEAHARERECHSAWLDTFQARGFYEALGYVPFGELEDYPPGQSRYFLRKRLVATS